MDTASDREDIEFLRRQDKLALIEALRSLETHDHLALIYKTREEQFDAAIPFIATGLAHNEKCIYITDDNAAEDVIEAASTYGIDVQDALATGDLEIADPSETYLQGGYFDPDEMVEFLHEAVEKAKAAGYSALRATGEMTWQLGGDPGTDALLEYEARLNDFLDAHDCLAICQYNYERFSPEVLREVIRTHPDLVYGYTVAENFYYVPPDEYLDPDAEADLERWLTNIAERERMKRDLQNREDQLDILTTVLRHRLRNDTNLIQGLAEELEETLSGEERERAAKIVDVGNELIDLCEKAGTAEQIIQAQSSVTPTDLPRLVETHLDAFRSRYPDSTFRFETEVEDVCALCADQFGTALDELIENTVKLNRKETCEVEVTVTRREPGAVDLDIADNGQGISEMDVKTLTGEREIDPLYHGSRVDLWIAHWLVTRSRGELRFRENDPHGPIVTIRLPQAESAVDSV
ncbi:MEDS domain-containing protein [Haloplanus aerogenes]|uniref:histidine kinase n=1 Tax=Haloplanus aerogenes TaxID=660522 RepID=A0A3M0DXE6_9EURY|nr:MEDS domain-containing protein [Haloplanus aerogenes]AZH24384.1 hypothetical protein DU502_02875 [Haloplanus aerogenes]RMB23976.1 histidine kinase/DNA gyrase B/HSP90-like ATPase [Haloplanus aerogenes]